MKRVSRDRLPTWRRVIKLLGLVLGPWVLGSNMAVAQVGSGWTAYTPPTRVQIRGCASHGASGGVETFGLTCADNGGDNRAEQRIENDYGSGARQFEGEVRVVSLGGTNVSLKQTFMPNNGAFLMIAVGTTGRLYSVGDNGELAAGIIGKWVRINTVHDVGPGTHKIFVDGVLRVTKTGGRQVQWHDKYGTYRLGSGRGPIVVEWRNVRYFKDGTVDGSSVPTPPSADGGAGDAGPADALTPDAAGAVDAPDGTGGTGGAASGGTSGSGGAGAAGGAGGSGGRGSGRGGAGGVSPDAAPASGGEPEATGCTCALGEQHSGGSGGAFLTLTLALAALLLRSRRSRRSRR